MGVAAAPQRLAGVEGKAREVDVESGRALGVGQLQRLFEVLGRLARTADRQGLLAGADAGRERGVEVVRLAGMPGELGRGAASRSIGQGGGVPLMQPNPLAGQ